MFGQVDSFTYIEAQKHDILSTEYLDLEITETLQVAVYPIHNPHYKSYRFYLDYRSTRRNKTS